MLAGFALAINFARSGDYVIANLTSRSLGSLAPGYAASQSGFRIYAAIVGQTGLLFAGLGVAGTQPVVGAIVMAAGVLGFVAFSVLAIVGEVRTYRALKR